MTLAIGFGGDQASRAQPRRGFAAAAFARPAARYARGWVEYLAGLKKPPQRVRRDPQLRKLYDQSLLVLAASEDKLHRGASSPRRRCRGCGAR